MDITKTARTLRDRVESLAAGVRLAPETIDRHEQLGLASAPGHPGSHGTRPGVTRGAPARR